ncbi:MAG: DUF1329 domain-containing protein, partial [Thermodesulfobacteriota bacterium]|nr:DUF1329 domain-containing protein [Thermodesulfobacteriota bacterium]
MKKIFFIGFLLLLIPIMISAKELTIMPGTVITKNNYRGLLPEMKKLFTPADFYMVTSGLERGLITILIVEKKIYPPPKKFRKATLKNEGKFKVGTKNKLIGNWKSGLPFPYPETVTELAWNVYRRRGFADQMSFYSDFLLFDKSGRLERTFKWHIYLRLWFGRALVPPIPEEKGNNGVISSKESFAILSPFDVKGFSQIRIRYEDLETDDEVYSYIPAIRRIRRLTGADLTDPLIGSDATADDFQGWRQKINPRMTFKRGEGKFIHPCWFPEKPAKSPFRGNQLQVNWEIRDDYILEVTTNDPDYAYKKRLLYGDKERGTSAIFTAEGYDQKGRFWRSYRNLPAIETNTWETNAGYGWIYIDHISGHSTIMT